MCLVTNFLFTALDFQEINTVLTTKLVMLIPLITESLPIRILSMAAGI